MLAFLGSMNLAISLLVAISIASAIGTILQQNQPYNDYLIKFGPFWFEVFESLALYDVYSATWFLSVLGFLLISTSVCVYRNAPKMLAEIRSWKENVQQSSLKSFKNSRKWSSKESVEASVSLLSALLKRRGYAIRVVAPKEGAESDSTLLIARKGGANRIGYLFTHAAIVIICVGGLLDSRLPFKAAELMGKLEPETRNLMASEVPQISRLPVWNPSFRGSVEVPEGRQADVVFVNMRDGFLVQELPFSVEVKAFRVEHHLTGQPKSFESDLVIYDDDLDEPLEQTIAVNHPLIYKGYAIYQSSFGDGGSKLETRLWALDGAVGEFSDVDAAVNTIQTVFDGQGSKQLEFTDFRIFNINPVEGEDGKTDQRNFGPSMEFRVRNESGQAREYFNYMSPVMQDGQMVLLSGMRESVADPYRFLHIPVDARGGIDRFIAFLKKSRDEQTVGELARGSVLAAMQSSGVIGNQSNEDMIIRSLVSLVQTFLDSGFDGVFQAVARRAPEAQQEQVFEAYIRVLQTLFGEIYREVLLEEGLDDVTERELRWFDTAIDAFNGISRYGSPFYLQLKSFEHIEASGLQITLSPGKNTVYLGCVLLIAGVFMLFYIQHQRFWIYLQPSDNGSDALIAGTSLRPSADFDREFDKIATGLAHSLSSKSVDKNAT